MHLAPKLRLFPALGALTLPLSVFLLSAPAQAQGLTSGDSWRTERLDLEVTVLPEEGTLEITGVLHLRLEAEHSDHIVVALNGKDALATFHAVQGPPGAVVRLNETSEERPQVRLALVELGEALERGAEVELDFFCMTQRESNQLQVDPGIALASWVEGWYPFLGEQEASFSKMISSKGSTTFHLPEGWDVVSNGVLRERVVGEDGVEVVWEVESPVARSFAAGPYRTVRHRVGGREVGVYLLPGTELDPLRQAELLAAALAAQEERFGPYPYPTYAIAEVPEGSGGFYASSEQGFIMAKSSAFAWEHGNLPLWGHEMAHGWWGNLVGSTGPGSILCSESLAQYSAVIAIEALEGPEEATEFLRFSRPGYPSIQCAQGYFSMLRDGQDRPLSELGSGGWQHNLSDAKGHWFFHMLRRRIGDELFFRGLRELIENYADEKLSLADLRSHFLTLAPDEAELERFLAQWLDRTGAPVLGLEWRALPTGEVELRVTQEQTGEPYHLRLDVALEGSTGSAREAIVVSRREERFVLSGPGEVSDVVLDPGHALLIWHPDYGE